jgi:hypothetical protein
MSWPEALELLSAELDDTVTFRVEAERQFLKRLTGAGVPAREAELLITRVGDPRRRERLHNRHFPADQWPPATSSLRVPSRLPCGIPLMATFDGATARSARLW